MVPLIDIFPFRPEPVEQLRARYPKAVSDVVEKPGRKHVFDFPTGMRLVVTISQTNNYLVMEIVASTFDNHQQTAEEATQTAVIALRSICGDDYIPSNCVISSEDGGESINMVFLLSCSPNVVV